VGIWVKYLVIVTVFLTAMVFAMVGPWLSNELAMSVIKIGLNNGQGATALDYLALALFYILITPCIFFLDFSTTPPLIFAVNGACWVCVVWCAWNAWHVIRRKRSQGRWPH